MELISSRLVELVDLIAHSVAERRELYRKEDDGLDWGTDSFEEHKEFIKKDMLEKLNRKQARIVAQYCYDFVHCFQWSIEQIKEFVELCGFQLQFHHHSHFYYSIEGHGVMCHPFEYKEQFDYCLQELKIRSLCPTLGYLEN